MRNLLAKKQNRFYHDYKIVVAAGSAAGIGVGPAARPGGYGRAAEIEDYYAFLRQAHNRRDRETVDWHSHAPQLIHSGDILSGGVPCPIARTVRNPDGDSPNKEQIIKEECYVFDFAPDRALRQIADYSCRLNVDETNAEKKVAEFISFLPVSPMTEVP